MTGTQLLLFGLVVVAAVAAGYFIGRWSSDRELGARSARPSPLPGPDELPDDTGERAPAPPARQRGAPPPASAGGDAYGQSAPPATPRQRSAPPPAASAGGDGAHEPMDGDAGPRRVKRGPPPPAAAGVMGSGEAPKRDR